MHRSSLSVSGTDSSISLNLKPTNGIYSRVKLSQKLNLRWVWTITILLFASVIVFLASNVTTTVDINMLYITFTNGQRTYYNKSTFYSFNILKSVRDLWRDNEYTLSLVVLFWGVLSPYAKIISLILGLYLNLTHRRAHKLFITVDRLGKWSFFDIFVFTFIMIAMEQLIIYDYNNERTYLTLHYVLDIAIILFSIGVIGLMILSTYILIYHKNYLIQNEIIKKKVIYDDEINNNYFTFNNIVFSKPVLFEEFIDYSSEEENDDEILADDSNNSNNTVKNTLKTYYKKYQKFNKTKMGQLLNRAIFFILLLFQLICLISAFLYEFFEYKYSDLVSETVKNKSFTITSLPKHFVTSTNKRKSYARYFAVLYVLLVIVLPYIITLQLYILWLIPLPKIIDKYVNIREIVWAFHQWSCIDVVIMTGLILGTRISSIYSWLVLDNFEDLCDDVKANLDTKCGKLSFVWHSGLYYLTFYCLFEWTLMIYTMYYTGGNKSLVFDIKHIAYDENFNYQQIKTKENENSLEN